MMEIPIHGSVSFLRRKQHIIVSRSSDRGGRINGYIYTVDNKFKTVFWKRVKYLSINKTRVHCTGIRIYSTLNKGNNRALSGLNSSGILRHFS